MLPQVLIIVGAAVFGTLGTLHLVYTFFTHAFDPRDAATGAAMRATSPRLTSRLSVWDAWVGFNASHSLGAMLFAAIYLVLAIAHMELLRHSPALVLLGVAGPASYLAVGLRYWFRTPIVGVALATACFAAAAVALLIGGLSGPAVSS
jgi:hypothetical protein